MRKQGYFLIHYGAPGKGALLDGQYGVDPFEAGKHFMRDKGLPISAIYYMRRMSNSHDTIDLEGHVTYKAPARRGY